MGASISSARYAGKRNDPASLLPRFTGDTSNSTSSTNISNRGFRDTVQGRNRTNNGTEQFVGVGGFTDIDLRDGLPFDSESPATVRARAALKASNFFKGVVKWILLAFNLIKAMTLLASHLFKVIVVALLSMASGLASKAWMAIRRAFTVFTSMVLASFFPILFGPEINADHRLLGMSEETLNYLWASTFIGWLVLFIVHLTSGPWSTLQGFQGTCHRIICIVCVVLPLLLKIFEPKQIPISFCPAFFTMVVEMTGHFIRFTAYVAQGVWWLFRRIWNTVLVIWQWLGAIFRAIFGF